MHVKVYVCVCVRERERERERGSVCVRVYGDDIKTLLLTDCIHGSLTAWYTKSHPLNGACSDGWV